MFGRSVQQSREKMGRLLAREHPVDADVVVPVPDSGVAAALGYSAESGIPFRQALIRNHYVGRTFIEPSQAIRDFGVKLKLNPVRHLLEGKRVVLVDDSSCAAPPAARSCAWCATRAHAKYTCASPARPQSRPVTTAWIRPAKSELIAANQYRGRDPAVRGSGFARATCRRNRCATQWPMSRNKYCYACYTGDTATPLCR